MHVIIQDDYLLNLYTGAPVPGKPKYPDEVIDGFIDVIQMMVEAENTAQLRKIRGLRFKKYEDRYSVRVTKKWRIEFDIGHDDEVIGEIILIEDLNNHYGD